MCIRDRLNLLRSTKSHHLWTGHGLSEPPQPKAPHIHGKLLRHTGTDSVSVEPVTSINQYPNGVLRPTAFRANSTAPTSPAMRRISVRTVEVSSRSDHQQVRRTPAIRARWLTSALQIHARLRSRLIHPSRRCRLASLVPVSSEASGQQAVPRPLASRS